MKDKDKIILIRKLLHKSCNRGCKEMDIIISQFAKSNLHNMSYVELKLFDKILDISDLDLYNYYTKKEDIPKGHHSGMMSQIMNFISSYYKI